MKVLFPFAIGCMMVASFGCQSGESSQTSETNLTEMKVEKSENALLRHVVLLSFKEESSADDIKEVEEAFIDLQNQIPQIKDFEWGTNNSPEGLNKGLTHCFFVTFESEEDREIYLPHPAHKAFVEVLGPHMEDVTVIDYWAK